MRFSIRSAAYNERCPWALSREGYLFWGLKTRLSAIHFMNKLGNIFFFIVPPRSVGPIRLPIETSIMIPLDTVKTRLVTQAVQSGVAPYRGVLPTLVRIAREEGLAPLYRSLMPRLASVVPMIGIQVGTRAPG